MTYKQAIKRRMKIIKLRSEGKSLRAIGRLYGISGERVRQIILLAPLYPIYPSPSKYNWVDGVSPKGRERTRELARMRDGHKCQTCNKKWKKGQRRFDVHHLNGLCGRKTRKYDRLADIDTLITLCHKCHYNHPEHTYSFRRQSNENSA